MHEKYHYKVMEVDLPITGMSCSSCAVTVEKTLRNTNGVESASVNFANQQARITFDPEKVDIQNLTQAVQAMGYEIGNDDVELDITGMSCAGCVRTVENALKRHPGVISATVNLNNEKASVSFIHDPNLPAKLVESVKSTGFGASVNTGSADEKQTTLHKKKSEKRSLNHLLNQRHFCHRCVFGIGFWWIAFSQFRFAKRAVVHFISAHAAGFADSGRSILCRRLERAQTSVSRYEFAHRARNRGRVFVFSGGNVLSGLSSHEHAFRLLRYRDGYHHPYFIRTISGIESQGTNLGGD